jgi:hypothetical protein
VFSRQLWCVQARALRTELSPTFVTFPLSSSKNNMLAYSQPVAFCMLGRWQVSFCAE